MLRIALLHLSLKVGNVRHNERLIENAARLAAELGAEWVVTPELCLSGYEFAPYLGTDWIGGPNDTGVESFRELARQLRITLFLGHAERDAQTQLLYNTVFVIGPGGEVIGKHHKRTVIPGIEGWSSPDEKSSVVAIPSPWQKVGILICADAYRPEVASRLREQGASVLVSSAAWAAQPHGPETSWEDRTRET
jgi:N-carbamoylputrescine amidase